MNPDRKLVYHVELHEYQTERLLSRSKGMTREEAKKIEALLNKSIDENVYVYISVDWSDNWSSCVGRRRGVSAFIYKMFGNTLHPRQGEYN